MREVNPDCRDGKHRSCAGDSWDVMNDCPTACTCAHHTGALRALTVRQPWASALLVGGKDVENRTRDTHYRGPLIIHAGKVADRSTDFDERLLDLTAAAYEHPLVEQRGMILGIVDVVSTHHSDLCADWAKPLGAAHCSPWAERDSWHWVVTRPSLLATPLKATGALGLWRVDDGIESTIYRELLGIP